MQPDHVPLAGHLQHLATERRTYFKTTNTAAIIELTVRIQDSGCAHFIEVAMRLPDVWATISAEQPNIRGLIARIVGWPLDVSDAQARTLPTVTLAGIVLNHPGRQSAQGLWCAAPRLCNRLHRAGRLEAVFALLGVTPTQPPPEPCASEIAQDVLYALALNARRGVNEFILESLLEYLNIDYRQPRVDRGEEFPSVRKTPPRKAPPPHVHAWAYHLPASGLAIALGHPTPSELDSGVGGGVSSVPPIVWIDPTLYPRYPAPVFIKHFQISLMEHGIDTSWLDLPHALEGCVEMIEQIRPTRPTRPIQPTQPTPPD